MTKVRDEIISEDISRTAVSRIISSVGASFAPSTIDVEKLRWDLNFAATLRETVAELGSKARGQKRSDRERVNVAAMKLRIALNETKLGTDELLRELSTLIERTRPPDQGNSALADEMFSRSPFEYFVGVRLKKIYEKHFDRRAAVSRSKEGDPSGPFVRFVLQTLIEFRLLTPKGTPYSAEAVRKAVAPAGVQKPKKS